MFRYEVQSRLEELAEQPDGWFRLRATAPEGAFEATDPTGATAAIDVREHWVEVSAARPVGGVLIGGATPLLRISPGGDGRGGLRIAARLYLDGFSVQALFAAVRDVLALAGGGPPAEHLPGMPAGVTLTDVTGPDADAVELTDDRAEGAATMPPPDDAQAELFPPVAASVVTPDPAGDPAAANAEPSEPPAASAPAVTPDENESGEPEEGEATTRDEGATHQPGVELYPAPSDAERRVPSTVESARPRTARVAEPLPEPVVRADPGHCRRCGSSVQPGERFCMNCGAPQAAPGASLAASASQIAPEPSAPTAPARRQVPETVVWRRPPAGLVTCPRCAEANAPEATFCQNCGTPLVAAVGESGPATGESAPAAAGATACSRCGYANAPDNRFCQGCGASLA